MKKIFITLLLLASCVVSFSQVITKRMSEPDGFEWIQLLNANDIDGNEGARSIDGKDIVPLYKGYKLVHYEYEFGREGYFAVMTKYKCHGIYSKTGKEIIPVSKGYSAAYGLQGGTMLFEKIITGEYTQ